jgi:hypothetical protein
MMNNKQRARWLSDLISETQRYLSKSKDKPEVPLVQKALNALDDARRKLLENGTEDDAE